MQVTNAPLPLSGLLRDLSNADYHAHPALSKSQIADFMVCPANYYGLHLAPDRPPRVETPGQRAGTLLHTLVLEPHAFDERYAVGPDVSRATKEWKNWEATLKRGISAIKPDEFVAAQQQAANLRAHSEVAELLEHGIAEASIFWTDPQTGLALRCRPDWLHETTRGWIVLDVKTGPAAPWAFASQCARMSYHGQAAMYSEGIEHATGKPVLGFVFGVVETSPPYLSSCPMLDDDSFDAGRKWFRDGIARFATCREKDEWPGFEGVQLIRLPAYALAHQE